MLLVKAIILVLTTAGIIYVSGSSLTDPRSHGFYRAFAWEAIVVLILLNLEAWFRHPFSWHQVVSWFLLTVSVFLIVEGTRLLKTVGMPGVQRAETHLIGIERTTRLTTVGTYRFIRHPLYGSLLFLAWGVFFKVPSWPGGLLASAATVFLVATAKVEESENIRYFGSDYIAYMARTKRFVPFVF